MTKDIQISIPMKIAKKNGVLDTYAIDGKTHVKSYYSEFILVDYLDYLPNFNGRENETSFGYGWIALQDIARHVEFLDNLHNLDYRKDKLRDACHAAIKELEEYAKVHDVYL